MKSRKKDFTKFTKRNVHKRRSKDAAREELMRAVRESGVGYDGVKLRDALDSGRSARRSPSPRGDELCARGIYSGSRSDFGFVSLESGGDDIFIPAQAVHGAIDGDFVEIIYHKYKNSFGEDKTEGRVTKIIEYGRHSVIGTLSEEYIRHGRRSYRVLYIQPDDSRVAIRPRVRERADAEVGDKVEALIKRDGTSYPDCDIIRVFGDPESKEANYDAILAEEGIVVDFTDDELSEAARVAAEPISFEGRCDFTREIIFTMDGEGAKDLDDAVSVRRMPFGYRLGVHIADVSHYVRERTVLDRCVMSRGTSVYFTDKVVPMLPTALSNGACSLNSGEPKYTLSAIIDLDKEGNILKTDIRESVINSRVRGVYSEINAILSGDGSAELKKKYSAVLPAIERMYELYEILAKRAEARCSLDFDSDEAEIVLDDDGCPERIERRTRGTSERMIEQFMLTANEAVATILYNREIPCVYRIHEMPPPDHLGDFLQYAESLGLNTRAVSREKPTQRSLGSLLDEARERGVEVAVSYAMLRSMAKARYSEIRSAHFGLNIDTYCHFTSPIRRLSDLATHRIIKAVLLGDKRPANYASYARRAAAAATEGELRAVRAERRIEDLYKVIYMSEYIGEIYPATVNSITGFGMFCTLDNTCEGLVPISELPGVFSFDERNLTLRSRDKIYRISDRIYVRVEETDITRGNIRFSVVDDERLGEM